MSKNKEQRFCKSCEDPLKKNEREYCSECIDLAKHELEKLSPIVQRNSVSVDFAKGSLYDNLECLEVTEWTNGEGYDISVFWKGENEKLYSFTSEEIDGIANALYRLGYRPLICDAILDYDANETEDEE